MRPDECLLLLSGAGRVLWAGMPAGGFLGCTKEEWMQMALPPPAEGLLAPVGEVFRAAVAGVAGEAEGDADFHGKTGGGIRLHWRLAVLPAAAGDSQVLLALSQEAPAGVPLAGDREERARTQLRELTARLDDVREEERTSIARELHDELGKSLTLLTLDLAWLRGRLAKTVPDDVRTPLGEKIATMEQTIKVTVGTLRRILAALRPPLLDELGLKEAIEFELQEFSKRIGIRFEMRATAVAVMPDRTRTAVFRIFQEVLTNVARHARASRIKVELSELDSAMVLVVEDNGCGISEESLARSRGFGILGIQERVRGIGGEVEFGGRLGSGTRVTLRVPLARERSADDAEGTAADRAPEARDEAGPAERVAEETPQRVFAFDDLKTRRR